VALGASPGPKELAVIVRRLATVTAAVTIALAGGAAVPSIASASSGHPQAKPARGVAWTSNQTSNKAGKKPSHGVAWTGAKPVSNPGGVTWTGQRPAGVAWTR
jgi:hypothetical protein